ncbi:sphingolipid long chain base-responsive protein LSP1 [Phlyctema vagabunda]|uniref:Sphingolipid long chain base-responsive protein LSP1 n=1 Tax=Phlyctema vagabunda TaxID=108571 RepID=A0ABR4P776_9HELO
MSLKQPSRSNSRKEKNSTFANLNRALSIRSNKEKSGGSSGGSHRFNLSSLRGTVQPELSKKLYKLIKSENHLISSYEAAGKERIAIATQLSDWGEATNDEAVSEISDKIGVLLSELGEQEDLYAHNLDDSRAILKAIRNTEKSVQPSRDNKAKIADEIAKLKVKEPESARLVTLEQELVRAEAENLVAEAQLTNITRQKMKEAYAAEFAATIERAEKQIILARHARRVLNLLDDTPVVPGTIRPAFEHGNQARQILNDAEDDLRDWQPELEDVPSNATGLGNNAVPSSPIETRHDLENVSTTSNAGTAQGEHLAAHSETEAPASRISSGTSVTTGQARTYEPSEAETSQVA